MPNACETAAAIFIPPLAASYARGCGVDVVLNVVLWAMGALPGIIHAFYLLHKRDRETRDPPRRRRARPAAASGGVKAGRNGGSPPVEKVERSAV